MIKWRKNSYLISFCKNNSSRENHRYNCQSKVSNKLLCQSHVSFLIENLCCVESLWICLYFRVLLVYLFYTPKFLFFFSCISLVCPLTLRIKMKKISFKLFLLISCSYYSKKRKISKQANKQINKLSCISFCCSLLTFLFVVTRIFQYKNARMRLYLKILHYIKQTVLSLFSCCSRLWMQSCWFYYRDCQNL